MTLDEAKKAARSKGYFIACKPDCFLLYREAKPKNVLVGKRQEEKGIIALVKKVCTVG
jgi:hypothetical protein